MSTAEAAASGKATLGRSILSYSSAIIYCRVAAIAQNLIVIRWMDPEVLGVWLGLQLLTIYGAHLHFGLITAVNRQLPFHRGRGELEQAEQVESVARGSLFCVTMIGLAAVILMSFSGITSSDSGRGIVALSLTALLTLGINFHLSIFRARNEFGRAGLANVVNATMILIGLPLVYAWRYDGLLWRAALASALTLFACWGLNGWKARMRFDWPETKALMKIGIPIMILGLGLAAFASMDRTLILRLLDKEAMGHYAICFAVARIMALFPTTIGQIFYPRMTAIYAAEGVTRGLLRRCWQASALSGLIVAGMALGALLTLPWAVEQFFPKYAAGLPALRVALLAYTILSLAAGPTYFLISTVQKRRQLTALLAGAGTMVLVATQFAPRTLVGIAWSLVLGTVIYIAGLWAIVFATMARKSRIVAP